VHPLLATPLGQRVAGVCWHAHVTLLALGHLVPLASLRLAPHGVTALGGHAPPGAPPAQPAAATRLPAAPLAPWSPPPPPARRPPRVPPRPGAARAAAVAASPATTQGSGSGLTLPPQAHSRLRNTDEPASYTVSLRVRVRVRAHATSRGGSFDAAYVSPAARSRLRNTDEPASYTVSLARSLVGASSTAIFRAWIHCR
jgi:hypothetical protein